MSLEYLNRHPLEVDLPPGAWADLAWFDRLKNEDICPTCETFLLREQLEKECGRCGAGFEDPEIKRALEQPKEA